MKVTSSFSLAIMLAVVSIGWTYGYFIAKSRQTTVILVRHGDRTGENLNDLGNARAQELARVLDEAAIQVIYASNIARTQQTAQPLADRLGLSIQIYDPNNIPALVAEINANHRNKVVLVVGHSNTVPETIGLLGYSPQPANIADAEFDLMYILTYGSRIRSRLIKMEYGANN